MATLSRGQTFGVTETVTNTKLHDLVDSASITGILNADIDNSAAIANSKLVNLTDAGKVSGSSFFNLTSIPSGAGAIPMEQLTNSVLLATLQTISSLKYFATLPIFSDTDPSVDGHPAVKNYVDDRVVIATGTAANGATIALPSVPTGRATGDYTWHTFVSINSLTATCDANATKAYDINCSVNGSRVVTCVESGGSGVNASTGTVNYIIIGVLT